ncbi:hypothetical protein BRD17_01635 [Halobacteriales archaeon SW_7_68_16]|nr:MAG: hypothetical protein BRD17_01635 [Halobacteriales archaeon SW_7_68_16]
MSTSQHPVALRLERSVGGAERLLATVMGLPLVDGIFPALVLMAVAAVEAALAPTIQSLLDMATFKRFAALVIAAVAAKTASATIGEYLPRPAAIVGLGLIASLQPGAADFTLVLDLGLIARAVAAAAVGVGFALAVALTGPRLRTVIDIDRFRFGSAVALGLLPLSLLGLPFGSAPLAVVGLTALFALDPDGDYDALSESPTAGQGDEPETAAVDRETVTIETNDGRARVRTGGVTTRADGGLTMAADADGDADEDAPADDASDGPAWP